MKLLKKNSEENLIEFITSESNYGVIPEPYPTRTQLPQWLKELRGRIDVSEMPGTFPVGTVKRCMPFLDVLTTGYIIPLSHAVRVSTPKIEDEDGNQEDEVVFAWPEGSPKVVDRHDASQLEGSPFPGPFFKWVNPWRIKTPPGYSTLFVPILNNLLPFECFAGYVDTDTYDNDINFPFYWVQPDVDMLLDRGTPLIQAIPIKRETWNSIARPATKEEEFIKNQTIGKIVGKLDGYKSNFRAKKRSFYK